MRQHFYNEDCKARETVIKKMLCFSGQFSPPSSGHDILQDAFIPKELMKTKWFVGM